MLKNALKLMTTKLIFNKIESNLDGMEYEERGDSDDSGNNNDDNRPEKNEFYTKNTQQNVWARDENKTNRTFSWIIKERQALVRRATIFNIV